MADRPPAPDPAEEPDRYPGTPGWVKALGVIAIIVVLLIAFILVIGLGGPHGPQRHGAGVERSVALAVAAVATVAG
jgi:hypothetical protein